MTLPFDGALEEKIISGKVTVNSTQTNDFFASLSSHCSASFFTLLPFCDVFALDAYLYLNDNFLAPAAVSDSDSSPPTSSRSYISYPDIFSAPQEFVS